MVKEAWEGCKVEGWGAFVVKEKLKCVKRVLKNGIWRCLGIFKKGNNNLKENSMS